MSKFDNKIKYSLCAIFLIIVAIAFVVLPYILSKYDGDSTIVYIRPGMTNEQLGDTLKAKFGTVGERAYHLWKIRDVSIKKREGAYKVTSGCTAVQLYRDIATLGQEPFTVSFNNVRTAQQLTERVTSKLMISADDLCAYMYNPSTLKEYGLDSCNIITLYIPDSYQFHWNVTPKHLLSEMKRYHDKFWNAERIQKANKLNLTPEQVATIASIVEEETNKADEQPLVARLYINRVEQGMCLQADPTVKYAVGDFSLRRITGEHLKVESPYNTYKQKGLPPGPIRIASKQGIDAVLNAPQHDYIYMCAKDDFSGYHNFSSSYAEHKANASRYHKAINALNIK